MVLASTEIGAFHIAGGLLALWAVVVSVLGLTRHGFPGKGAGQTVVMAISIVLVLGTVVTAVTTSEEKPKSGEQAGFENKAGPEGSEAPDEGGAPAAGESGSGQDPGEDAQNAPPGTVISKLTISADPGGDLRFNKSSLEAPAGPVRITMSNPVEVPHNVAIEGPEIDKKGAVVNKGGASEVEADLAAGDYTFYCSVAGHREAGMEGTLTVK